MEQGIRVPEQKESNEELFFFSAAQIRSDGVHILSCKTDITHSTEVSQAVHIIFQTILVTSITLDPQTKFIHLIWYPCIFRKQTYLISLYKHYYICQHIPSY